MNEREEFIYDLDGEGKRSNSWKPLKYVVTSTDCWESTSHALSVTGYTVVKRGGRTVKLHRLVYEKEVGVIPEGLVVMHSCDNPTCFNPNHLSVGTMRDNMNDKVAKGRQQRGEGHGNAKLTEEDVRNIRRDSRPKAELAKEYGVKTHTITRILNREQWKHVD